MAHDNKLFVYYLERSGQAVQELEDVYDWNSHRYFHEIDIFGNLSIYKAHHAEPPPALPEHIPVRVYARGIWTRVFLDYDEHAT